MKRYTFLGMGALLGLSLMTAPASASQKGVDACTKTLQASYGKTVVAVSKVYNACIDKINGCHEKPAALAACISGLTAAGGKCNSGTLNVNDPASKAGKPIAGFLAKIGGKCDPGTVLDPTKITLGEILDPDPNNFYGHAAFRPFLGASCAALGGTANPTTYNQLADCLLRAVKHSITISIGVDPESHAFAVFGDTGLQGAANTLQPQLGTHNVVADVTTRLNTAVFPADITGIVGSFEFAVGGVDTTGVANLTIPGSSASFTPVAIPAFGLEVCVTQPTDGAGKICCAAAGCPGLGPKNYTANQDHDSSGLNTAFGFLPGSVDPLPDSGCSHVASSSIAGLPAQVTLPCFEKQARPGACNATALGENNPNSSAPRCAGGPNNGRLCDPTQPLANQCPAGGTSCASRSPAFPGASLASPCNSAAKLLPAGTGFGNGDLVADSSIQFRLHEVTIDNIINATGAAGMDAIPDGFGADGLPCTADDTTPPNNAATISLTTGSASSTVFNANMVPSIACPVNPGEIKSSDAGSPPPAPCAGTPSVGAVPANACRNLSVSVTTGYDLAATFPALGGSTTGDTATAVHEVLQ